MAGCYKFLSVPLTEEEMNALREVAQQEGRSMGRQFRVYGVERLAADARRLGAATATAMQPGAEVRAGHAQSQGHDQAP